MAINVNFNNEEAINTKVQDLNYIPTYKEYEKERQENEIERQAYYEDFKMRVENGEFKGDTGEGLEPITTDTNIYDLDTGLYSVEEGVSLTYTEMYASDHPPILVSAKSILKVVKKVVSEEDAYVYYTLTTLNPAIDSTHESPIGVYQGSIHLLDFFTIRWYGQTPTFISETALKNLVNGSFDYEGFENKPKINNVELIGNKTLEDLGIELTGNGIPEITEDTNIYDLESGMYYVNEGVKLTHSAVSMDGELTYTTIMMKSILNVFKVEEGEYGLVHYNISSLFAPGDSGMGTYYGKIDGMTMGGTINWIGVPPTLLSLEDIKVLTSRTTSITSSSTDDEIPTAKAVYDLVNSMINK